VAAVNRNQPGGGKTAEHPTIVPIATRAWCRRAPHKPTQPPRPAHRRPDEFIAIHIAETGDGMPAVRWGCARIGEIGRDRWRVRREVWFHGPGVTPDEIAEIENFIAANTLKRGAGDRSVRVWRDEIEIGVRFELMPIANFAKLFYAHAWKGRALVIGHDLLAVFGALAVHAGQARRGKKGRPIPNAWSLVLVNDENPNTGETGPARFLPRIIVVHAQPEIDFIDFAPVEGRKPQRGEFLDTRRLSAALIGENWSFESAVEKLAGLPVEIVNSATGEVIAIDDGGPVAMRAAGRALVVLTKTLVGWFDLIHPGLSRGHGGTVSECGLYSPGSIARAYQIAAGYSPAPAVDDKMLGLCASATFGAWCGIGVRSAPPIAELDFRRQYALIYILQRIGELAAARVLRLVEATAEIKKLAATLTEQDLGPAFNAICLIKPNGEPILTRALYGTMGDRKPEASDFQLAVVHRASDEPVPAFLAHVVASRMLDPEGQVLEIVKAWRIEGVDLRPLQPVDLMGETIDPARTPLPLAFVLAGKKLEDGKGRFAAIPPDVREYLVAGVKAAGNIAAYGSHLMTIADQPRGGASEEVTLLHAGEPVRGNTAAPENDTHLTCVPLGGLVAGGGFMLLASLRKKVRDRGGWVACWDTDSAHVCASPEGGDFYLPAARGRDGKVVPIDRGPISEREKARIFQLKVERGSRGVGEKIRLLSWAELDEIIAEYRPLNPFPEAYLDILRLTKENFDENTGEQHQLVGYYISGKRYCLEAPDGSLIDTMASGIGSYLPPIENLRDWPDAAWRYLNAKLALNPIEPRWLDRPLVRELVVSTPEIAAQLGAIAGIHPGARYLVGQVEQALDHDAGPQNVTAEWSDDPEEWSGLDWFYLDGTPVDRSKAKLVTWGRYLDGYARAPIFTELGPDGEVCGAFTRGLLRFRHIRDGERFVTLKESAAWGEEPSEAHDLPAGELFAADGSGNGPADLFEEIARPAIVSIGASVLAPVIKLSQRVIDHWGSNRTPKKPAALFEKLARAGYALSLLSAESDPRNTADACRLIPERVRLNKAFASAALAAIAKRFGVKAVADTLGISKRAVYARMQTDEETPLSFKVMAETIAGLAAFCIGRAEADRYHLRPTGRGPLGQMQVILAWLHWISPNRFPGDLSPRLPDEAKIYVEMAEFVRRSQAVATPTHGCSAGRIPIQGAGGEADDGRGGTMAEP
jgi:hypothetical protein